MVSSDGSRIDAGKLAATVSFASLAVLVFATLYLVCRPLDTGDLWWHLSLGELFASHGPWVEGDPLVHTALPSAPSAHEWLFQAVLHGVNRGLGFYGLRVLHGLVVAGILGLVYSLVLRQAFSHLAAVAATGAFILLAWYRLFQLRPDLVSIPACFLLYRLLLEARVPPSPSRIAASAVLLVIWANAHPLFAIGPALLVAALLGIALRALLSRWAEGRADMGASQAARDAALARRIAVALLIGLVAALFNPRGLEQHLTFLHSASADSLWLIGDEWTPFNPFAWGHYVAGSVSLPMFVTADLVIASFLVAVGWRIHRFWTKPGSRTLDALDPVLLGLAVASVVAILVSVRFLWMSLFPLLYLVHCLRVAVEESPGRRLAISWTLVSASLVLASAYPSVAGFRREASQPAGYLSTPYVWKGYSLETVRFLRDTGVEGKLFNNYGMGGFLGYWLAPQLQVYLDSRIESPPEVMREYAFINGQLVGEEGQSFLQLLEMREVDFFLGAGLPMAPGKGNKARYTTTHLDAVPGWILVFRGFDQAVYARVSRRNALNLQRIAAYYARQEIPFDLGRGLDVARVIAERPRWAIARGLLPARYLEDRARANTGTGEQRQRALHHLGLALALAGAYEQGVVHEGEQLALQPDSKPALRRLIFDLLHLRRPGAAVKAASRLVAVDPDDVRSRAFLALATRARDVLRARQRTRDFAYERSVNSLPVVLGALNREVLEARYLEPSPL